MSNPAIIAANLNRIRGMSNTCQLCYTPNTVTRLDIGGGGSVAVCVDADACWDHERVARAIRIEEHEEQRRQEQARNL